MDKALMINLASALMGVLLFICIYWALKRSINKNVIDERIEALQGRVKQTVNPHLPEQNPSFFDSFVGLKKTLETNFKKFQNTIALEYRHQFERAGFTSANPAILFLVMKTGFVVLSLFSYNLLLLFSTTLQAQSYLIKIGVFLLFALLGNRALNIYLHVRIQARYALISRDITSALDLLILATNAGLSLDRAFEMVAEEISYSNMVLGREFAITSIELTIMPDRRQAIKNLAERIEIELIQDMTTTLVQSEEQGTPIAQTLRLISEEFFKKRVLRVESKAARLPVLLVVPLILLILPSLFIVLMTPAIIQVSEKF